MSLTNGRRASIGAPALASSSALGSYARDWARHMAETDTFAHSNIGSLLGPWGAVAENVARGYGAQSMFDALVASAGHCANIDNASYTHIGVGVYVDADGQLWMAQVFGG